jgi:2-amino-4-hydroxy-6-hydroxymethyldihydropteridine diphosphokinase
MNKAYFSLGTNRGNRAANLERAIDLLSEWVGDTIIKSSVYETPPWRMVDKTNFFNQVILLEIEMPPLQLIDTIIIVETMMGRKRIGNKYESRIMDIDILFFNEEIINTEELVVPHPLIRERKFVLEPMVEIAPDFIHPIFKKSILQLLMECDDKSDIKKLISK